ncbi:MAG: hypothetical protein JWN95_230 [Frankiales bacterium]|nr:hypothetical protein [Frankiales bacterium]
MNTKLDPVGSPAAEIQHVEGAPVESATAWLVALDIDGPMLHENGSIPAPRLPVA